MLTHPLQLLHQPSDIDLIAPEQFSGRLCLVKTTPRHGTTPIRHVGKAVSMNKLWPALKFNSLKELFEQLKLDDVTMGRRKATIIVAANNLARAAGVPINKAGFAYLLGKGGESTNFLIVLKKNDTTGDLLEDGILFDFYDHICEIETEMENDTKMNSSEGHCSSAEFQHAFKIAMTLLEYFNGIFSIPHGKTTVGEEYDATLTPLQAYSPAQGRSRNVSPTDDDGSCNVSQGVSQDVGMTSPTASSSCTGTSSCNATQSTIVHGDDDVACNDDDLRRFSQGACKTSPARGIGSNVRPTDDDGNDDDFSRFSQGACGTWLDHVGQTDDDSNDDDFSRFSQSSFRILLEGMTADESPAAKKEAEEEEAKSAAEAAAKKAEEEAKAAAEAAAKKADEEAKAAAKAKAKKKAEEEAAAEAEAKKVAAAEAEVKKKAEEEAKAAAEAVAKKKAADEAAAQKADEEAKAAAECVFTSTGVVTAPPNQDDTPSQPLREPPSERIGLLKCNTQEELHYVPVEYLLRSNESFPILTFGGSKTTVSAAGMSTLKPKKWIGDEIINGYLQNILKPLLGDHNVIICNSFFMTSLLATGPLGTYKPNFTYTNVARWHDLTILDANLIFVPINWQQTHWLFLTVKMKEKTIMLLDPQGVKGQNYAYLTTMLTYLGTNYRIRHCCSSEEWEATWTLVDESDHSPRQSNSFDCGLFLLAGITLLSQQMPLTAQAYSEEMFSNNGTRERIAMLLWKASTNKPLPRMEPPGPEMPSQHDEESKTKPERHEDGPSSNTRSTGKEHLSGRISSSQHDKEAKTKPERHEDGPSSNTRSAGKEHPSGRTSSSQHDKEAKTKPERHEDGPSSHTKTKTKKKTKPKGKTKPKAKTKRRKRNPFSKPKKTTPPASTQSDVPVSHTRHDSATVESSLALQRMYNHVAAFHNDDATSITTKFLVKQPVDQNHVCQVCEELVEGAIQVSCCINICCYKCLPVLGSICPVKRCGGVYKTTSPCNQIVKEINLLQIHCPTNCGWFGPLTELNDHKSLFCHQMHFGKLDSSKVMHFDRNDLVKTIVGLADKAKLLEWKDGTLDITKSRTSSQFRSQCQEIYHVAEALENFVESLLLSADELRRRYEYLVKANNIIQFKSKKYEEMSNSISFKDTSGGVHQTFDFSSWQDIMTWISTYAAALFGGDAILYCVDLGAGVNIPAICGSVVNPRMKWIGIEIDVNRIRLGAEIYNLFTSNWRTISNRELHIGFIRGDCSQPMNLRG